VQKWVGHTQLTTIDFEVIAAPPMLLPHPSGQP